MVEGSLHHHSHVEPRKRRDGNKLKRHEQQPNRTCEQITYEEREAVRDDDEDHGGDRERPDGTLNDLPNTAQTEFFTTKN